jgi:tetratricopeptide (TPR) repeat protein
MNLFHRLGVLIAAGALAMSAGTASAADHPWEAHQALLKAVMADVKTRGITGVRPHASQMEAALSAASTATVVDGDTAYAFGDGPAAAVIAAIGAAATAQKDGKAQKTVVVDNPYPALGFFLGSMYNEAGRPDDALRVLDRARALDLSLGVIPGQMTPIILVERGAALTGLRRWPELLANAEQGLKIGNLTDQNRARLLRQRGFALVELTRLDEAEQSYHDALRADPGDARAPKELAYIARLRAGGAPTTPMISLPGGTPH